jgi:hypothetical protein
MHQKVSGFIFFGTSPVEVPYSHLRCFLSCPGFHCQKSLHIFQSVVDFSSFLWLSGDFNFIFEISDLYGDVSDFLIVSIPSSF